MKILTSLLFIFYFNHVFGQFYGQQHYLNSNVLPRRNMQILMSRKYLKGKPLKTKRPTLNGYTFFPASMTSLDKKLYDVPSSPYFHFDSQKRVKKVLDDHDFAGIRKKRSAHGPELVKGGQKEEIASRRIETRRENVKRDRKDKLIASNPTAVEKQTMIGSKNEVHKMRVKKGEKENKDDVTVTTMATVKRNLQPNTGKVERKRAKSNKKSYKRTRKQKLRKGKIARSRNRTKHHSVKDKSRRLIAAQDAVIEDFPYVVSIQKNGEHWCAGALINPLIVITTANCLWKSNRMTRLRVRVGSQHSDRGGKVVRVQEVMKHPRWSIRSHPDNDVALMLLNERLDFSDKLHAVDLPNRIMMPAFEDAWVTSWGAERRDGVIDKKSVSLQVYHARLMNRDKCNNVTKRFGIAVTENFICLTQVGRRAPCTRDTGAPAVSDGILWGLASWGIRKLCGTERFPAMFSYLASQTNMDWIANATRYMMSDQRFAPFLDRYPTAAFDTRPATDLPMNFGYVQTV